MLDMRPTIGYLQQNNLNQQWYQPWKEVLWFIWISLCLYRYFSASLLQYYLILFYIN